jgi:hypothetical protein
MLLENPAGHQDVSEVRPVISLHSRLSVKLVLRFAGCDNFYQGVKAILSPCERDLSTEPFELSKPVRRDLFPVLIFPASRRAPS